MNIQAFISKITPGNRAYLLYDSQSGVGIALDPGASKHEILTFAQENQISIRFLLLSEAIFEKAYSISEIKQATGALFYSFQSDLLLLRNLPRWADERNVCGIKIPHVDHFLDDAETIDFDGFRVDVWSEKNYHQYGIGKLRLPEK